ncbi:MAG: 5' nucleotidase, NT5C type [Pseudonocardiaceae bacterium]
MGSKLRVGVDLDGVVADFVTGWITRYNADFGTRLRPSDAVEWHAPSRMTHFGSTGGFWRWARTAGPDGHSLFRDLPVYPGARDGLAGLTRLAHVVVVTTKPQWGIADTLAWLGDLDLPLREVHITDDKTTVDCAMYVEDSMHHLAQLRRGRPHAVVCRWVRPWNAPVDGCLDVEEWGDVHVVARELARRGFSP